MQSDAVPNLGLQDAEYELARYTRVADAAFDPSPTWSPPPPTGRDGSWTGTTTAEYSEVSCTAVNTRTRGGYIARPRSQGARELMKMVWQPFRSILVHFLMWFPRLYIVLPHTRAVGYIYRYCPAHCVSQSVVDLPFLGGGSVLALSDHFGFILPPNSLRSTSCRCRCCLGRRRRAGGCRRSPGTATRTSGTAPR